MHKRRLCLPKMAHRDPPTTSGHEPSSQDHHGYKAHVVSPWAVALIRKNRKRIKAKTQGR